MSDWGNVTNSGDLYSDTDLQLARNSRAKTPSKKLLKKEDLESTKIDVRGMGKTGLTRRVISDAERMTVCMLRGKGLTETEIGEKLSRPKSSIVTILRQAESQARAAGLNYDWREDLKEKSVTALRLALTTGGDVYKGGNLALGTLKGLGEFENEGTVNFTQLIGQIPEAEKSRYITLEPADVRLISSEAPHEAAKTEN